MDDLVYICTKIARQMDAQGLDRIFDAAEAATSAIEEARPLLQRVVELVDEVHTQAFLPLCVQACVAQIEQSIISLARKAWSPVLCAYHVVMSTWGVSLFRI